jgi:hypothetical protein
MKLSTQPLTARCAGNGLLYRCTVAWHSDPMTCPRCGETVDRSAAPVTLDGGRGSWVEPTVWNQQHGCGEWVEPQWATSEPECIGFAGGDLDSERDHEREALDALEVTHV